MPVDLGSPTAAAPTPEGVRREIGPLARRGLGDGSIVVVDPSTRTVLLDQQGARPRIPASTAKLATATAALTVLGPQTRLPTIAYREKNTIYLVGGGDPTLARSGGGNPLAGGRPSLRELARAVAADFTAQTRVSLVYDASAFRGPVLGPGWPAAFPAAGVAAPVTALVVDGGRVRPGADSRVADPAKQAGSVFAGFLRGQGLTVASVTPGTRSPAAAEVARVESPQRHRHRRVHADEFGEQLRRGARPPHRWRPAERSRRSPVARRRRPRRSRLPGVDDGPRARRRQRALGQDRVPATLLADVLATAVRGSDPALAPIPAGLAVAGLTGTLADRFATSATRSGRGFVHAKTGTLTGVVSLAGTVQDADGRILVFAMIANKVASLDRTRETMDVIASRLATCGCRCRATGHDVTVLASGPRRMGCAR